MRCFVIGPIGDEGSETRRNADQLFEYLILPVLQTFNFDVVRADRISTVTSITEEIIRLVQESELCIIDLTESNPNVFYEAGRRHETGKPYIHLLHAGQKAPFDVQGTRYVSYKDLSLAANVFDAQSVLKEFVQVIARSGFGASKSTNPLNNIEESLKRIESRLSTAVTSFSVGASSERDILASDFGSLDPLRKVHAAYEAKNYRAAELALLELDEIYVDKNEVVYWAGRLARYGRRSAAELVVKYLSSEEFLQNLAAVAAEYALPGLGRFYVATGQGMVGQPIVTHLVDRVMKSPLFKTYSMEQQAIIANSAQAICYNNGDLEAALKYNEMACELEPIEPIWFFNHALTLFRLKDYLKASSVFDRVCPLYEEASRQVDPEVLEHGVTIYNAVGQKRGVEQCLGMLRMLDSERERRARESLAASIDA